MLVALIVLPLMFGTLIAAGIPLTGVGIVTTGTTGLAAVTQISSPAVTGLASRTGQPR